MHFSCPHEYQLDSKDCGPACIKIIAKYYGRFFSLQYLRDICGVSGKSTILVPHIPFVFNPRIKYYSFVLVRLMQLYEIEYFGGLKRQGEKGACKFGDARSWYSGEMGSMCVDFPIVLFCNYSLLIFLLSQL